MKVKNKTKKTTWLQKNGKQLLFIMKKYTIYKWSNNNKKNKTIYRPQFGFRQAEINPSYFSP